MDRIIILPVTRMQVLKGEGVANYTEFDVPLLQIMQKGRDKTGPVEVEEMQDFQAVEEDLIAVPVV